MDTRTRQSRPRCRLFCLAVAIVAAVAAAATVTPARATVRPPAGDIRVVGTTLAHGKRTWSYAWPLKPFGIQHPIRGFFNDPRMAPAGGRSFHWGIDIAAPDRTSVYAVDAGTVVFDNSEGIRVMASDGRGFAYWHIVPLVRNGQWVRRHQRLGRIGAGWEHVHLGEIRDGRYVNPLRDGGIGPYADPTAPTIDAIKVVGSTLVVAAHDTTHPRVPGAWADEPVTPALIRWRVGRGSWHVGVDFRSIQHSDGEFALVYTPWTRQNRKGRPGRYSFYVARAFAPAGTYTVYVEASDTAGNRTVAAATVMVAS